MPTLQEVIKDPEFNALPEPERMKVLKAVDPEFSGLPKSEQMKVISALPQVAGPEMEWRQDRPTARAISGIARPVLEMGGLAAGGLVGGAAGAPTGPGAVATGVAGAALGYGVGANIADRLDEFLGIARKPMGIEESSVKAARDIGIGAMYEMGGQVASKGITLAGKGLWSLADKMGLTGLFKKIKNLFPNLSDEGILLKAQEELTKIRTLTPEAQKTAAETGALIGRTGIKTEPTFGQRTGGQQAATFEQSAAAKSREIAEILKGKDAKINQEALDSIQRQFKEKGGVSDVITGVQRTQAGLKTEAEKTAAIAAEKTGPLALSRGAQTVGQDIKASLDLAKKTEKDAISEIYSQIPPGVELSPAPLTKGLRELSADFGKTGGGSASMPSDITRQMVKELKATEGKSITFDNLRDWKSQIGEEKRAAIMGMNPNLKLYRRLKMLENTVDDTMDQLLTMGGKEEGSIISKTYEGLKAEKGYSSVEIADLRDRLKITQAEMEKIIKGDPEHFVTASGDWSLSDEHVRSGAVEVLGKKELLVKVKGWVKAGAQSTDITEQERIKIAYDTASKRYKDYAITFKKGTVGEVLQAGQLAEGGKVALSDIPSRFFRTGKMDAADDLVRAVGKEKAGTLIDDYASNDLISRAGKEGALNPGVAYKWLSANKDVLNKYGLYGKYADIIKSNKVSAEALAKLADYNKTIASKVIGVDVEDVIRSVFSGAGKARSATVATELLNLPGIKGNPTAINGLQNSFKDFLLSRMELSAVDVAGNPVRSIAKAKSVLNEYLPAMRVLYKDSPEKITALLDYHKVLEMLARNKNISFAGGSTTAEKFTGTEAMRTIGKNVAQYMAVSAGAGWKFSVMKNLWSATLGAPRRFSESQVAALLTEAIHNPEVAKTIMAATKTLRPKDIQVLQKSFRSHLIAAGLYAVDKAQQEDETLKTTTNGK